MKFLLHAAFTILWLAPSSIESFGVSFSQCSGRRPRLAWQLSSSSSSQGKDESAGGGRKRSIIEGNARPPTAQEKEIMDEMITKLVDAKIYELPNAVRRAFRVISSPAFFLRIADRVDQAEGMDKEKLVNLASNLVATLETVVETTEEQLDERSKQAEDVVKAAAEPDSGEFLVPLLPERVQAMKDTLTKMDESALDEGFLSTIDAWMNKSHKDGMDLMVGILQKVLQLYAGLQIKRQISRMEIPVTSPESIALLETLLDTDTETWDRAIDNGTQQNLTLAQLKSQIQVVMEKVILSLNNGSLSQRIQAEYMQELSKRVDKVEQTRG
jgi:hypothetical protein